MEKTKDKINEVKLRSFANREYKDSDMRAKIIKRHCDRVLKKIGIKDPLLNIVKQLEEAAMANHQFIERKMYPNVNLYRGITFKALGFPTNKFTALFATGRLDRVVKRCEETNYADGSWERAVQRCMLIMRRVVAGRMLIAAHDATDDRVLLSRR